MSKYDYSIIGSSGFIGSNIASFLENRGYKVLRIGRELSKVPVKSLGIIIYCAGYGNCQQDPINVVDANVVYLSNILKNYFYDKIFYISSTRVYLDNDSGTESTDLKISMSDSRKLFNLTKLTAEALLEQEEKAIILRLSNVYGNAFKSPLFLPSIVRDAIKKKVINLYTTPNYAKDYINIETVCNAILMMSRKHKLSYNLYNIASGENITSNQIVDYMIKKTEVTAIWHEISHEDYFPPISIQRLQNEIEYVPSSVLSDLDKMIDLFREEFDD